MRRRGNSKRIAHTLYPPRSCDMKHAPVDSEKDPEVQSMHAEAPAARERGGAAAEPCQGTVKAEFRYVL